MIILSYFCWVKWRYFCLTKVAFLPNLFCTVLITKKIIGTIWCHSLTKPFTWLRCFKLMAQYLLRFVTKKLSKSWPKPKTPEINNSIWKLGNRNQRSNFKMTLRKQPDRRVKKKRKLEMQENLDITQRKQKLDRWVKKVWFGRKTAASISRIFKKKSKDYLNFGAKLVSYVCALRIC